MRIVAANHILRAQLQYQAAVDVPVLRPFGLYTNATYRPRMDGELWTDGAWYPQSAGSSVLNRVSCVRVRCNDCRVLRLFWNVVRV